MPPSQILTFQDMEDFLSTTFDPALIASAAAKRPDSIPSSIWARSFLSAVTINTDCLKAILDTGHELHLAEAVLARPNRFAPGALLYLRDLLLQNFTVKALESSRHLPLDVRSKPLRLWTALINQNIIDAGSTEVASWIDDWFKIIDAKTSNPTGYKQGIIIKFLQLLVKTPNISATHVEFVASWASANEYPDLIIGLRHHPSLSPHHIHTISSDYNTTGLGFQAEIHHLADTKKWCEDPVVQPSLIEAFFREVADQQNSLPEDHGLTKEYTDSIALGLQNLTHSIKKDNLPNFLNHLIQFAAQSSHNRSLFLAVLPLLPKKILAETNRQDLSLLFLHKDRHARAMAMMLSPYLKGMLESSPTKPAKSIK